MVYVDTDCALGSGHGDVDDGFALAALLHSDVEVCGIGTVFGNTDSASAWSNTRTLARLCHWDGPVLMGAAQPATSSEASEWLSHRAGDPVRVLAIGPLTNIAVACERAPHTIEEIIVVGGNSSSSGRWPPVWPFEFNLTHDRDATWRVFRSDVPITVVPLDVARRLRAQPEWLEALHGNVGDYLRTNSTRWRKRSRWVRGRSAFPIWDLVAAIYVISPTLFEVEEAGCTIHRSGWIDFSGGSRTVQVVKNYDPVAVWTQFRALVTTGA